jgi:signal transduction histidine kinase
VDDAAVVHRRVVFFVASDLAPGIVHSKKEGTVVTFTVVTVVVMVLVRRVLGDREHRLRLAERERDLAAREAVVEERARIARELHDAIAHNVSMIVMQAGAERRVLNGGSGATREVLETIEQIGRGALTEMRRLVGMLRAAEDDPLGPQPSLADLGRLVAQVTEAGLPVELEVEGEPRQLPFGIELSATESCRKRSRMRSSMQATRERRFVSVTPRISSSSKSRTTGRARLPR